MPSDSDRARKVASCWSLLYSARRQLLKRYRTVWDIPIRNKHTEILLEELAPGMSVLEIGSYDRGLEDLLSASFPGLRYTSMDVDREYEHDYYSLDEIEETFDAVLLFEVIEHMPFGQGVALVGRIYEMLKPGGKLIMTTPNVAHPTHYYRDPTHVMPYSHEGIGGVLVAMGFDVAAMYRIYNAPLFQKVLRLYAARFLHRYLGIDFAHSLLVVAKRPEGS